MGKKVIMLQVEEIEQVTCPYLSNGDIMFLGVATAGIAIWLFT